MQPGDTLAWVAQSMGVSQYDLIAANGIANPDFIYVGQVLSNPSCGAGGYGLGAAPAAPYADGYAAARAYGDAGYAAAGYDAAAMMRRQLTIPWRRPTRSTRWVLVSWDQKIQQAPITLRQDTATKCTPTILLATTAPAATAMQTTAGSRYAGSPAAGRNLHRSDRRQSEPDRR